MSKKSTDIGVGKKALASALSAAMVVAFAPAVAMADDGTQTPSTGVEGQTVGVENAVAQTTVNGTTKSFDNFASAIKEADSGAEVRLLSNSSETSSAVSIDKKVIIDLNGYSLETSQEKDTFLKVTSSGALTVQDSSSESQGKIVSDKGIVVSVASGGSFELNSGEIEGAKGNNYTVLVNAGATVEISGGKISYKEGVSPKAIVSCSGQVNMTGGSIEASNARYQSVYVSGTKGGKFNVSGGSISGRVYLDYGTLTSNSTPMSSAMTVGDEKAGSTLPSVSSIEIATSTKRMLPVVTLNKGNIGAVGVSGSDAGSVKLICKAASSEILRFAECPDSGLLPSGVKFAKTTVNGQDCYYIAGLETNDSAACVVNNGSSSYFATASAAAASLGAKDTLKLLKDCEEPIVISAEGVTLDLNNRTITASVDKPCVSFVQLSNAENTVRVLNGSLKGSGSASCLSVSGSGASVVSLELDKVEMEPAGENVPRIDLGVGARIGESDENVKLIENGGFAVGGYIYGYSATAAKNSNGQAIRLVNDYTGGAQLFDSKAGASKAVFDLNGKTYNYKINSVEPSWGVIDCTDSGCDVTVKNGTLNAGKAPVLLTFGRDSKFSFSNMKLTSDSSQGIVVNGGSSVTGVQIALDKSSLTMNSQSANVGVYFPAREGMLEISDSKVRAHTGVQICSGNLAVTGADTEITATGTSEDKIENDGPVFDGSAVSVINRKGYGALGKLTLSQGNFNAPSSNGAIHAFTLDGTNIGDFNNDEQKLQIIGGTFSSDPSTYLASGYVVSGSGPYTVSKYVPAPVTPVDPTPTPTPKPEPAAPGTNVSGTDSAGNTVEATVTDNNKTTLPDGTEAAGSVEFKGTTSGSGSGQPASEAAIPSTVTSNGSTYVVTKIADGAFEGQEQLTKVTIPETVVEIGSKAFANTSISSVVIPAATTTIGAGVFQGCDDLESVDISKAALTSIPADAFNGTAISSISIPGTVKSVGARAFKGTALKSVELPAATTTLGTAAFQGCASLKSADISKAALTEISAYAFNGASITSIDIPDTVKTIGKRAFKKTKLKTVSTDAESLERGAFSGCASLKSASLPEVTEIGEYAFYGNDALKTLTTGADLEAIGPKAFKGAGKFKVLRINSKRLTKSGVKGSLKGSAVTRVEVAVTGSKKTQDKYVKRYSKFFAKANSGKSVEVTKAKKASKK